MSNYYLIDQFLDKCERSSRDWREGLSGNRTYKVQPEDTDRVGLSDLIKEAEELERTGLVKVKWYYSRSDVEEVIFQLEHLEEYYRMAGRTPKAQRIRQDLELVDSHRRGAKSGWLKQYYEELYSRIERGKCLLEAEPEAPLLFTCLDRIEELEKPEYVRSFSNHYLGDSKTFEKRLKSRVLSIAVKYHPLVEEDMEDYEILSQLYLETYAQEMALKGPLRILLEGKEIDLSDLRYGLVLNSETLKRALPAPAQRIRRVITVENKANFVAMSPEEDTLIVFSHGFFSPLERDFLRKLEQVIPQAEYLHTGDLDYGGVRIFSYIRKHIFPNLKPWLMDVETYERHQKQAVKIKDSALEKLKKVEEPLLQPLICRMIETGKGIEQECFLWKSD